MHRITPMLKYTEHEEAIAKQRGVSNNIFFFTGVRRLCLVGTGH